jgi:DnaK suppressor protein
MSKAVKERASAALLAECRVLIERKIAEVRQGLTARRAHEWVACPEEPLDSGDWCQKSHDEWLFLNQNRIERQLLRELEGALLRLEDGSYGVCLECGETISPKRLAAVPWAGLCMSCGKNAATSAE